MSGLPRATSLHTDLFVILVLTPLIVAGTALLIVVDLAEKRRDRS